ncbi:hypothetical protein F5B20DRAFT_551140 [Whalleya microplaca]|nr:hypothetical protein F5B20DRAFT_551140 [Whalleya microplaca]
MRHYCRVSFCITYISPPVIGLKSWPYLLRDVNCRVKGNNLHSLYKYQDYPPTFKTKVLRCLGLLLQLTRSYQSKLVPEYHRFKRGQARQRPNMYRLNTAVLLGLPVTTVAAQSTSLNVTAIAGVGGRSVLQCWQMRTPFAISTDAGTAGVARADLSDVRDLAYLILPSNYDGGLHTAPAKQWVAFVSGLAHLSLPDDPEASAYVLGGDFGLIFAADTADVSQQGHITRYPGNTETIALQIPTRNGTVPPHNVLHAGPCGANEVSGVREIVTQRTDDMLDLGHGINNGFH